SDTARQWRGNRGHGNIPREEYGGVGPSLDLSKGFIVVMQHPVTTEVDETLENIRETVEAVKCLTGPAIWFWPNVDAGADVVSKLLRTEREHGALNNVHFFRNMRPE